MVDRTVGAPRVVPHTLRTLVESRAREHPDAPFVVFDDLNGQVTTRSYGEFDRNVNRTAHLLCDLGVRCGETLCLLLGNGLEFLDLWFAAAKIGAVIVPANTASSAAEVEFLVAHSDSRLIVAQTTHLDIARQVATSCPKVERVLTCGPGAATPSDDFAALASVCPETPPDRPAPAPGDDAAILYTSGTTARPKGVVVTHGNYICAGKTVAHAIRLTSDDRHLVVLPLFHGNAQYYSTMSTLVTGASMALMARFSASRFFDQAITHRCTVSSLFAAPIRMLLAQDDGTERRRELVKNGLRVVLFAQNITSKQLDEWDARFGAPLLQLWGMTETMGPPLMNPIDGERRNMSMGKPVVGYEVRLTTDTEIVVRGVPGDSLMKGYFKNPEATAATIRDGWLHSGDNARVDANGYFHFVDRAKDMIKRAGENVAASEVEAVIRDHAQVFDCAVIGVPDDVRDEAIVAIVVPDAQASGPALTEEEVVRWCRERLAAFRVPQAVRFRDELPRTAVGKIQKHILRRSVDLSSGSS